MPYKANEARRHKIPRARYKVRNWPEYDRALQQRGSLTVWVTPEALAAWHPPRRTGQRGRPRDYSDVAIETGHLLRLAFGRPWRQTEGLLHSLTILLGVSAGVPDHTTFSRRSPGLALATALARAQAGGPVHVVIDATGLKVYGAGELLVEKHGARGKRTWRKLVWGVWCQVLNVDAVSFLISHPCLLQPGFGSVHNDPRGTRHRARTIAPQACMRSIAGDRN